MGEGELGWGGEGGEGRSSHTASIVTLTVMSRLQ